MRRDPGFDTTSSICDCLFWRFEHLVLSPLSLLVICSKVPGSMHIPCTLMYDHEFTSDALVLFLLALRHSQSSMYRPMHQATGMDSRRFTGLRG